ncbi:fiber-1 [Turkey adenovirus 1]|uniref:Fiber-1 n=1 Tax=Turkey adenovirus 1 TaxID=878329 RepID=E0YC76_9ADEN|nr:fiber-1 [Turkey adenovirus 1]ADM53809.1 fiber-1 [Turkey adenovirus 1]
MLSGLKRRGEREDEEGERVESPPTAKTLRGGPTTAPAARAYPNDDQLDLVYPFQYAASGGGGGGGGGSSVTVDPDGPLTLVDGVLGLNVKTPVVVSDGAVALFFDGDTLALKSVNRSLMVKTAAPVTAGTGGGVTLLFDAKGLTLDGTTGALSLRLDTNGPLAVGNDGLTLTVDPQSFEIVNRMLRLKGGGTGPTYLSPFATYTLESNGGITGYSGIVQSDQDPVGTQPTEKKSTWNVGYYVFMVTSAAMVNGYINVQLPRIHVAATSGTDSLTTGLNFTFVLPPMYPQETEGNLSNIAFPVLQPTNTNSAFVPNAQMSDGNSYLGLPDVSQRNTTVWHVGITNPGLRTQTFVPTAQGATFGPSSFGMCPATVNTGSTGNTPRDVLVFTFALKQTGGSNWFQKATTETETVTTGPIFFSYQGYPYSPSP